jgi:hypothetical protein
VKKYFIHTIFVLICAVALLSLFYERYPFRQDEALYQKKEKTLLEKIYKLEELLKSSKVKDNLSKQDIAAFKIKGLANPAEDLKKDLIKNAKLIPSKGTLGGSMGFYSEKDIKILSSKWVIADFDDGHNSGKMLLRFDVPRKGKITWKVIDYYLQ